MVSGTAVGMGGVDCGPIVHDTHRGSIAGMAGGREGGVTTGGGEMVWMTKVVDSEKSSLLPTSYHEFLLLLHLCKSSRKYSHSLVPVPNRLLPLNPWVVISASLTWKSFPSPPHSRPLPSSSSSSMPRWNLSLGSGQAFRSY